MNDIPQDHSEFSDSRTSLNPGTGLFVALGIGLAIGAIVHAFRPAPKPQQRFARMIEDLEDSLRDVSAPALNKVGSLAADGAHRLGDRLHRSEAQVDKFLRDAARRLRRLAF